MTTMQALGGRRCTCSPPGHSPLSSRCRVALRTNPHASGIALRSACNFLSLKSEFVGRSMEDGGCRRGVEMRGEVEDAGGFSEEKMEGDRNCEEERRNHGGLAEASGSGVPSALYSVAPLMALADAAGYSQASYYTSLGLFLLSLPGVWSLVKRATKSKIVKKTFSVPGSTSGPGKSPKQIAGEITSFFTRSNFNVASRGDTVTFEGVMTASRGQAAFLTFCTFVSLGSAGLVLSIAVPDLGEKAYYITLLSPLAGAYYWRRATRTEQIQVKIVVSDDESSSDVTVQGDDEQIDRMRRELGYMEKGMVYVKGILEQ